MKTEVVKYILNETISKLTDALRELDKPEPEQPRNAVLRPAQPLPGKTTLVDIEWLRTHALHIVLDAPTLQKLCNEAQTAGMSPREWAVQVAYAQMKALGGIPQIWETKARGQKRTSMSLPSTEQLAEIVRLTRETRPGQRFAPTVRRLIELYYQNQPSNS